MKQPLGRGLDSLIPRQPQRTNIAEAGQLAGGVGLLELDITQIIPNDKQPRKVFDDALLDDLADSIRQKGVIQPIIVTKTDDAKYMIIEGERRWRASGRAGKKTIPAVVRSVETPKERLELALITNAQREDLNPLEIAHAFSSLMKEYSYRQEDLSQIVGKSRAAIANTLRLLSLPDEVQDAIVNKMITEGHARAILSVDNKSGMIKLLNAIVDKKLSVREAEALAKKIDKVDIYEKAKVEADKKQDVHLGSLVSEIEAFFRSKVNIKAKNKGGVIEIKYNSEDELDTIIKKIRGEEC